ncbi:MAG: hypothetical protein ABR582_03600 [Gemmatimonadaceae bacterium]
MWKWLGGCLVVVVVVIAIGVWTGYRKLSQFSGPNKPETIAIAAPVPRVFASIANGDSLSTWMSERMGVRASRHGMLVAGDTIRMDAKLRFNIGKGGEASRWIVSDVKPDQMLALELRSDSSKRLVAERQYNLTAKGDSTLITTAVSTPGLDSMIAHRSDTIKASDAFISGATKLMMSSLRMQAHRELQLLKAHIEGHAPPPPP